MIAQVIKQEADRAAAELARKQQHERAQRAAVIAALLLAARQLKAGITTAIARGRELARIDAATRATQELKAIGIDATSLGHMATRPLVAAARGDRLREDQLHAEGSADSLASQWRGVALAGALLAMRRGKDPSRPVAQSARIVGPRIVRTAHTETALAYNHEHEHLLRDAMRYDSDLASAFTEFRVKREWSALIDACPNCLPLDGVRVGVNEPFPGGAIPGGQHPRCRCIEYLVSEAVEVPARRAA